MTKTISTKIIAALSVTAAVGIAALPVNSFAASSSSSDTTTVQATVNPVLALRGTTTTTEVNMNAGTTNNSMSTLLEATCNTLSGYTIVASIISGGSTALVHEDDSSYTIPSYSSATALTSAAGWGMAISGTETTSSSFPLLSSNTYKGLSASSSSNIVTNTGVLTSGVTYRDTTVTYGISTPDDAAGGTYSGGVTYTITAN